MARPNITIRFRKLYGAVGNYGEVWEDHPRRGVDGHRLYYVGKRGDANRISAVQFFETEEIAQQAYRRYRQLQGKEIILVDEEMEMSFQVFVHQAQPAPPQEIGCTLANVNYRVVVGLYITRTA